MKYYKPLLLALLCIYSHYIQAEELLQEVVITDPYLELHTGHGNSYPVFHVFERGDTIEIILRHTTWFKIRGGKDIEGWVSLEDMTKTLSTDKTPVEFNQYEQEDYESRQWEIGIMGGRFGSANAISVHSTYLFNKILAIELSAGQAIGSTSSSNIFRASLLMLPFPDFKYSPYLSLGTGFIKTNPKTTLVQPRDTSNQMSHFSIGLRKYLSKRVIARLEYSDYVIFSANDINETNEGIKEWKAGIAIFF